MNGLRVGVAIGKGTGAELADVFTLAMNRLSDYCSIPIELDCSPRIYHSYSSLIGQLDYQKAIYDATWQDALHYEKFLKDEAAQGTKVIFRTAINAQSLYIVREHLESVKVDHMVSESNSLLLIRDQAQGFYTGGNEYNVAGDKVSRTCEFSKEMFSRIITYSIKRARQL